MTLQNQLSPALDFSLAAFYGRRWLWWPWAVAGLAAVALYALAGR
ncbi:MAG: hypothetical protein ABIW94_05520 [Gemmatimonadaceae bacterium]